MGKKARKEREEKRESFAAKRTYQKRKSMLMTAGVLGIILVIVGYSAYTFVTMEGSSVPGAPSGAGLLNDEHAHTSILVRIFGDKFDFTSPAFQIKSSWIHFEGQDGDTIHRHSTGVTLGYLFGTLGLTVDDECFVFPDGRQFCNNEDYSIKFFINHEQVPSIHDYIGNENDRVLISYGNESPEEIEKQLLELDNQSIRK